MIRSNTQECSIPEPGAKLNPGAIKLLQNVKIKADGGQDPRSYLVPDTLIWSKTEVLDAVVGKVSEVENVRRARMKEGKSFCRHHRGWEILAIALE